MEKKSAKVIYSVLGIILFLSTVNALHVSYQCIAGLVRPERVGLEWMSGYIWVQMTILLGRMAGGLAFSALLYAFTVNTVKGYRAGVLFPRKNFGILLACSVALFVYVFCYDNMHVVGLYNEAESCIVLDTNTFVSSLIFVVFALMYKVAVKVSEENSLTI